MTEPELRTLAERSPTADAKPERAARRAGRAVGRPPARPVVDEIQDDARRSVSVRINTSDYGRLKAIAGRLGVRESDVFRHLVRIGIARLMRVLYSNEPQSSRYRLLVSLARELGEDFGLSVQECVALLRQPSVPGLMLDDNDLHLVALSASHPQQACAVLTAELGEIVEPAALVARLGRYLEEKHSSPTA